MDIMAVIRASKEKAVIALYVDGKRQALSPRVFGERAGLEEELPEGPAPSLRLHYEGASQHLTAMLAIGDAMRYLQPFSRAGASVHMLTNNANIVKQLKGSWQIKSKALRDAKLEISALQNRANPMSLQAISPAKARRGVA